MDRTKQALQAYYDDAAKRRNGGLTQTFDDYFIDGVLWADSHPKPLWTRAKDEKPKANELMLVQSSDDIFLAEADYRHIHSVFMYWFLPTGETRFVYDYDLYIPISKLMEGGGQ